MKVAVWYLYLREHDRAPHTLQKGKRGRTKVVIRRWAECGDRAVESHSRARAANESTVPTDITDSQNWDELAVASETVALTLRRAPGRP